MPNNMHSFDFTQLFIKLGLGFDGKVTQAFRSWAGLALGQGLYAQRQALETHRLQWGVFKRVWALHRAQCKRDSKVNPRTLSREASERYT